MADHSEVFVGIDVSKSRHSVAIAEGGRGGEVRFYGEIEADEAAVRKLVRRLGAKGSRLTFCYEAGPTGYGLYRLITALGHECRVVAPSLIPRKPGERVKTNRRDATSLARLLRAGELTSVWAPDERHEAMRDLVRARWSAAIDLRMKRQQTSAFLLRLGRPYPGKKTWGGTHMKWLASQTFAHLEQRTAFEELSLAMRQAQERIARLETAIEEAVPNWSLAGRVTALMAMRGFDLVAATTLLAEIGDLSRFDSPRELMGWLGLAPAESSTGDKVRRFGITKAGNARARRTMIESAWCYRHPARVGSSKQARVAAAPPIVREIAWKAQTRLTRRYRALSGKGKAKTVVAVAVARELAGFVWAIDRALEPARAGA
jgi:transposase